MKISRTIVIAVAVALGSAGTANATDCTPEGAPVPGAPIPGSCFEAFDGDLADSDAGGPRLDWDSVPARGHADYVEGAADSQFGPGGAEEEPDSWTFDLGPIGSDKYDVLRGWSFAEPASADLFLALAFERATNNGETHLAFELNQLQPGYRTAVEDGSGRLIAVPTRSHGDLLITYSVNNNAAPTPRLGLCAWRGDAHAGRWTDLAGVPVGNDQCPELSPAMAQAAMNQADLGLMAKGTFGEAVVNLSDAFAASGGALPADPCAQFGYLWMHSRSSPSITSNQQDYILPDRGLAQRSCPAIAVDKRVRNGAQAPFTDGPALAHVGDTVEYEFTVTNPGNVELAVSLSDPKCDAAPSGPVGAGTGDGLLDPGEVWTYTCMHVVTGGDGDPLHNVVTVTGVEPGADTGVEDSDEADVDVLHPAIAVAKSGPATAVHGDSVVYFFSVTNAGDTPLADVVVTDDRCAPVSAEPVERTGDDGDALLETGEVWVFSCTTVVAAHADSEADPLVNTATATGTDPLGTPASATDDHSLDIVHVLPLVSPGRSPDPAGPPAAPDAPEVLVLPETVVSGAARLRGPSRCVRRRFTARVSGRRIRSVTWAVDGRTIKRFSSRSGRATRTTLRIDPARYGDGVHRLSARVTFAASSRTPARTLRTTFQRCARRLVQPTFTG